MNAFNVDVVTLASQLMASYRKIKSEKKLNYRVTSLSNHFTVVKLASKL